MVGSRKGYGSDELCVRDRVCTLVERNPGCCIRFVAERLSVDWSTAEYHLRILCRKGRLTERKTNTKRLFFLPDAAPQKDHPMVLGDSCQRVFEELKQTGEATASELAAALSIVRTGILRHVSTLVENGLIERHRAGRRVVFSPTEAARQVPPESFTTSPPTTHEPEEPGLKISDRASPTPDR